jgi:GxxExxY protein
VSPGKVTDKIQPRMEHGSNTEKDREMELAHRDVTEQIIGAAFEVYRVLEYGFLEKVYQRAMQVELQKRGLQAEMERKIQVTYKGVLVGDYQADLFVAGVVIVELKVAKSYQSDDEPQLLNELKATGTKVGLLVNFGRTKVEFKRMVF